MSAKPVRVTLDRARSAMIAAQGLARPDGVRAAELDDTLERTGFVRTLGGVEVYVALRARVPSLRAAEVHALALERRAQVIPAARGCIYLVGRRHVEAALRLAGHLARPRIDSDRRKAGVRDGELEALGDAIVATLERGGPLATDALRKALPDGTVRSLGDAGKKIGLSSTLPPALRLLELAGRVERALPGGRLDSERYLWRALPGARHVPVEERRPAGREIVDLVAPLAEVFLRAAGLGTVKELAAWTGVSRRDAAAAVARLRTISVEIEGQAEPRLALAGGWDELAGDDAAEAARAAVALLPFEDNLLALQGGAALLVDAAHHGRKVPSWGTSAELTLGEARHVSLRTVLAGGAIAGQWEYDPDARAIVVAYFASVSATTKRRVDAAAVALAKLLTELGHARSFSLDTDDELRHRAAWIRAGAATPPTRTITAKPATTTRATTKRATTRTATATATAAAKAKAKPGVGVKVKAAAATKKSDPRRVHQ